MDFHKRYSFKPVEYNHRTGKATTQIQTRSEVLAAKEQLAKGYQKYDALLGRLALLASHDPDMWDYIDPRQKIFIDQDAISVMAALQAEITDKGGSVDVVGDVIKLKLADDSALPVEYEDNAGVARSRDSEAGLVPSIAGQADSARQIQLGQELSELAI